MCRSLVVSRSDGSYGRDDIRRPVAPASIVGHRALIIRRFARAGIWRNLWTRRNLSLRKNVSVGAVPDRGVLSERAGAL